MQNEKKFKSLLKKAQTIGTGMFTSMGKGGGLATRPMQLINVGEDDGSLWFFSRVDAGIAEEIEVNPAVNVSFASPERNTYVAVSGQAVTVLDHDKREELWSPLMRSWFPAGVDDPQCILIKVIPAVLDSWDGPSWRLMQLTEQVVAIALGKEASPAHHVTVRSA